MCHNQCIRGATIGVKNKRKFILGFNSLVLHKMSYMEKQNYLEEFHAISKHVSGVFDDYLINEIEKRDDQDILKILYRKFLETKKGKAHSRATFVYIAAMFFDIPIEKTLTNILPLMVVPER